MEVQGSDVTEIQTVCFPQGSIWGRFLFIVVIKDFAFSAPCMSVLLANDTTLPPSGKEFEFISLDLVQCNAVAVAFDWFSIHSLNVNTNKT